MSYLVRRQPNRGCPPAGNSVQQLNGLSFPSNADSPTNAYVAIEFENPEDDGLPITGPSNNGVTVIMEKNVRQQTPEPDGNTRYYAQFWYTNGDRTFDTSHYWGFHPYPQSGSPGTDPDSFWEIAVHGADITDTEGGSGNAPEFDRWYTQGFILTKTGTSERLRLYIDLPSIAAGNLIDHDQSFAGVMEAPATASLIVIGDSPWFASFQHERFSGILGRIKIIATALSQADLVSEAADMSQLVTAAAQANIWWGKTNFESVDGLTCDYGTGRSFVWADSNNKATLVAISP